MEPYIDAFLAYLLRVFLTTVGQIFILMGPGLILAFLMHFVGMAVQKCAVTVLGYHLWLYGFKLVGAPIHEIGHAILCILFGHTITDFQPFKPQSNNGVIGYVSYRYNPSNPYQLVGLFFVGIGPILLGTIVIFYSALYLVGPRVFMPMGPVNLGIGSFSSFQLLHETYDGLVQAGSSVLALLIQPANLNWKYCLFIYIAFSVGNSITLSRPDIKGAWIGFVALFVLLFVFNLFSLWAGNFAQAYFVAFSRLYQFFYKAMAFALILDVLALILLLPIYIVRRR